MDLFSSARPWAHTSTAQRLVAQEGAIATLPRLLKDLGLRNVLLVSTKNRLAGEAGDAVVKALGRSLAATFDGARAHVPIPLVQEAMRLARSSRVDGIVSFGGGSCADLAKAVNFFTEQERGTPATSFTDKPALPHVAIPTTWSGAELTGHFGMTDPGTRRKQAAGSPTCAPVLAVYDPLAVQGLDALVSAGSGMNCLAHGIEAAWSPTRTPEAEAVALACISRTVDALPAAVEDPVDPAALTEMLAAAALGGRALQNASMGVHHGLAQLVGGRTGIAHGMANAILLTHSVAYNAADPLLSTPLHRIGTALGDPTDPAGAVDRLRERLGLPRCLSDVGVTEEDLEAVADQAVAHPTVRNNPRPVSRDEALRLLEDAFA